MGLESLQCFRRFLGIHGVAHGPRDGETTAAEMHKAGTDPVPASNFIEACEHPSIATDVEGAVPLAFPLEDESRDRSSEPLRSAWPVPSRCSGDDYL